MAYKLLVDLGNTRLKWARLSDGVLEPAVKVALEGVAMEKVLQKAWRELPVPESVWVSSVASDGTDSELKHWCERHWPGVTVRFPRTQAQGFGVSCAYPEPKRMGVDRWLALIAARHRATTPVCVVDVGTAVTLDALDADGKHLGGLILPGIALAAKLLTMHTGRLRLEAEPELVARADNTEDAVYSGSYWAIVALVERFATDLKRELRKPVTLLLTGGDAGLVQKSLQYESRLEPDLVLEGLGIVGA